MQKRDHAIPGVHGHGGFAQSGGALTGLRRGLGRAGELFMEMSARRAGAGAERHLRAQRIHAIGGPIDERGRFRVAQHRQQTTGRGKGPLVVLKQLRAGHDASRREAHRTLTGILHGRRFCCRRSDRGHANDDYNCTTELKPPCGFGADSRASGSGVHFPSATKRYS